MPDLDPSRARAFAVDVVKRLRASGYTAYWAGGCVRDQQAGRQPKDYDVATDAEPEAIRDLFGRRRTLAIGAAFGVITVLGPKSAGQVEVATFRRDAAYSDGRHPDSVAFSTAEEDAKRRDFTINGLFYDPQAGQVIDYVGGRHDLQHKLIRAIGDAHERIAEDKLRMLRAARFAAAFGFAIEHETLEAIRQHADEITVVSPERITAEMRRMLTHANRRPAVELLNVTGLLEQILPEASLVWPIGDQRGDAWQQTLKILETLREPAFAVALAALIRDVQQAPANEHAVAEICRRWRLSNEETEAARFCLDHEHLIRKAETSPWPRLQRVLVSRRIEDLMTYAEAVAAVVDGRLDQISFCRGKLALPPNELNPAPLISGDDLKAIGIPPGPAYKRLLEQVRDAQLTRHVRTSQDALELARELYDSPRNAPGAN